MPSSTIETNSDAPIQPLLLFYAYARKDEKLRDQLETHLSTLEREGVLAGWHDREIVPGATWEPEIGRSLEGAHIILLLISADFIASVAASQAIPRLQTIGEAADAVILPMTRSTHDLGRDDLESIISGLSTLLNSEHGLQAIAEGRLTTETLSNFDAAAQQARYRRAAAELQAMLEDPSRDEQEPDLARAPGNSRTLDERAVARQAGQ